MPSAGNLNGSPIKEPREGDRLVVLFDSYDPPTMTHVHVVEALVLRGHCPVVLCPLSGEGDDRVRAMSSILCADLCSPKVKAWMCSVALDKKIKSPKEVIAWLKKTKKGIVFIPACIWPAELDTDEKFIQIIFGGGKPAKSADPVVVERLLVVPENIRDRIRNGTDESRNIPAPVWAHIQRRRLYR